MDNSALRSLRQLEIENRLKLMWSNLSLEHLVPKSIVKKEM